MLRNELVKTSVLPFQTEIEVSHDTRHPGPDWSSRKAVGVRLIYGLHLSLTALTRDSFRVVVATIQQLLYRCIEQLGAHSSFLLSHTQDGTSLTISQHGILKRTSKHMSRISDSTFNIEPSQGPTAFLADDEEARLCMPIVTSRNEPIGKVFYLAHRDRYEQFNRFSSSVTWRSWMVEFVPELLKLRLHSPGQGGKRLVPFTPCDPASLSKMLDNVVAAIAKAINKRRTQCVIWSENSKCSELFVVATTGFDSEYRRDKRLAFDSTIGGIVSGHSGGVKEVNCLSKEKGFRRQDKVKSMGAQNGIFAAIPCSQPGLTNRGALVIYGIAQKPNVASSVVCDNAVTFPTPETIQEIAAGIGCLVDLYCESTVETLIEKLKIVLLSKSSNPTEGLLDTLRRSIGGLSAFLFFSDLSPSRPIKECCAVGEETQPQHQRRKRLTRLVRYLDSTVTNRKTRSVVAARCVLPSQSTEQLSFALQVAVTVPSVGTAILLFQRTDRPWATYDEYVLVSACDSFPDLVSATRRSASRKGLKSLTPRPRPIEKRTRRLF